jgi:hypothetical protein
MHHLAKSLANVNVLDAMYIMGLCTVLVEKVLYLVTKL